jgi:hypothetical protein
MLCLGVLHINIAIKFEKKHIGPRERSINAWKLTFYIFTSIGPFFSHICGVKNPKIKLVFILFIVRNPPPPPKKKPNKQTPLPRALCFLLPNVVSE